MLHSCIILINVFLTYFSERRRCCITFEHFTEGLFSRTQRCDYHPLIKFNLWFTFFVTSAISDWQSSTSLQHYGLVVLQQLLKQSITNRTYSFRAGLLSVLLDWFSIEEEDDTVNVIAELIQIIGAHSICGKDIRKIFALLRSEKISAKQKHTSLLLRSLSHMLKEKGPEAFFEFSGHDSVRSVIFYHL